MLDLSTPTLGLFVFIQRQEVCLLAGSQSQNAAGLYNTLTSLVLSTAV